MLNLFTEVISQWIQKKTDVTFAQHKQPSYQMLSSVLSFSLVCTTIKIAMRHLNSYRILNLATFYALKYI